MRQKKEKKGESRSGPGSIKLRQADFHSTQAHGHTHKDSLTYIMIHGCFPVERKRWHRDALSDHSTPNNHKEKPEGFQDGPGGERCVWMYWATIRFLIIVAEWVFGRWCWGLG